MNVPRFNHLAIAVNAAVQMLLGMIWYGIFAQDWLTHLERDHSMVVRNGPTPYLLAILSALALGYGLTWILHLTQADSVVAAIKVSLVVSVIFTTLPLAVHQAYGGFDWQLAAIDSGKELIGAVLAGLLLAVWKVKAPANIKGTSVPKSARSRAA